MKSTLHKTLALLPLVAAFAAFGSAAQAQTINVSGKVQDISCPATVVGGNTLNLAVVDPTTQLLAVNDTANPLNFQIRLVNCTSGAGTIAKAMFYSTTAGAVSGGRLNLASGSTGAGWQYEFLAGASGNATVPVRTSAAIVAQSNDPGAAVVTSGNTNINYRVQYRRNGPITTGTGIATVNFVMYYI